MVSDVTELDVAVIGGGVVGLAAASILYTTSNIIHHYTLDMHVAAALELFAAVATLFYYILRILMQIRDR